MKPDNINMDDEFPASLKLHPEKAAFQGKNQLKKNASDLTENQIEYLSVASLENDLSEELKADLQQNLRENSESRKIFDQVRKTRLIPPVIVYNHKNSLKRLTPGQKVFRIAVAGLSAAAAVAILITSNTIISDRNDIAISEKLIINNSGTFSIALYEPIIVIPEKVVIPKKQNNLLPEAEKVSLTADIVQTSFVAPEERVVTVRSFYEVIVPPVTGINFQSHVFSLVASNTIYNPLDPDDERSRVRRFIASTFRQKFLGEKSYSDDPLQPYEIAKASVDGLNKLLGWDMQLRETLDGSGEVKSVYFSAALISFNAPVNKSEEKQ
jgi:hypothetical protein